MARVPVLHIVGLVEHVFVKGHVERARGEGGAVRLKERAHAVLVHDLRLRLRLERGKGVG
jgi:hypothetical protein